ncbi:aminotransferase class I/II-fold pyridoxal phosphate-dependent enzyme [Lentilactobacillus otakiensis]|uniref:Aminotransferase n=1 Tax=Lentilactobacillus otakiensis DSM 19908 = JCM 15040 TaxID=1423780 RepID=S4NBS2_9LACO|nr:aminotransferase class I/II-fold pyridoxal phosphate-dependent enzyme [Lentilactobacillus otakiensis]KRL10430.1 aspartate transaminase [Lentilactobacillus otakiensis DSM 19908 = JCM 15040]MBZ3777098.1 aminotransferase class I/II-fold pyridoxal phosphate-dependent enzyme [Lentilactobacillus otakiensis]MDV3518122.1 aminotransferase class I/II-fold pyridoxal phosphate-dependent enzyme [Lentilactobacillus otakiensis]GAD16144.1 aspartate transaminase [Lentilactobacillus otakiensis DSM 19908 = JCM
MSKLSDRMNKRVAALTPAAILTFNQKISAIPDIVKLTLGEPDFNTPEHVKQAAIKAIDDNESHYTNSRGTEGLRQAAAHFLNAKYGLNYDPDKQVIMTAGATGAIYAALTAMINPGDTVIVPTPIFPLYVPILMLAGAKPIFVDTSDNGFVLSPEKLSAAIDANKDTVKAVILNFPNNPTGVTYHKDDLQKLADVISKHDIICLSDEIYSELTYDGTHVSMGSILPEQTLVMNGVSKSHAMTGWRVGMICGPEDIINEIAKVSEFTITSLTTNAQAAAEEAFKNGMDDALPMKAEYMKRRDILVAGLEKAGFSCPNPNGAFYVFAKIPAGLNQNSEEFCYDLAKEAKVALIPGSYFLPGGEGYVRISYAASEENIQEAVSRIQKYVDKQSVK